ncbi:MAG: efflux transporter outer membrane subunit [Betaproteobacteria bacterium]|nr:efflux transporter outer membrane subunit [Betaproteobacteria bacterium]
MVSGYALVCGLLLSLLAGCATQNFPSPPHGVAIPGSYANSDSGESAKLTDQWWMGFGSDELATIVAAAIEANPDLAIAMRRIEQAEAQARVAGAPLFPLLNLNAGSSRSESRAAAAGSYTNADASSVSFAASYEIDFWEKNASGARAAQASLAASRFDAQTARLTLVSGVASAYFNVLSTRDRLRIARENVAIAMRVLAVVNSRFKFGNASALDVNRQETTVIAQRAAIPPLELQERQSLAALALLLGRPPQNFDVAQSSVTTLGVPVAAPGMPADLMLRRPDLASAEAQLAAANANIAAARAALLPTISLTSSMGLASSELLSLSNPTRSLSLGSSLLQPIFNAGRLQAQVDITTARERELVETYRRAILAALADVDNSLAAAGRGADQEVLQEQVRERSRRSLELAELRYKAGADDLLAVLDAQRTLFAAQDQAAQVRLARLQASVALFKALGGGWRNPAVSSGTTP